MVRQKNFTIIISKLKVCHGMVFTMREDFDKICHDFNKSLYKHKDVSEETLRDVFYSFLVIFTTTMNESLTREITPKELGAAFPSMFSTCFPSSSFKNYGQP